ncbi:UbiA family prenyltransferase [Labedaea rhizosphaerae]|uniref:4-hydroxybenzoate polyprenyltransferase/geranylgeranylglycerol-phosphate geranylgeranyltransferase n=1 Tax=Labedaea rhizosphaerae TaxID=598644 RepID=A0A4R6S0G0_LABRH|nr:UbiA family prenyltransferase [Labedaea rhizosphaerae]TDP92989.1 4-hydroxybenzoate polyprenyltransferase/geranylgeranylglycerol-phosphate geranylgeranyltransferase [Labedaea rhizosphaerae]
MSVRETVRAHVETWRPYTLWYVGLVGLGGAAVVSAEAGAPPHPWRLVAAWAAPTAAWLGGHYLGDYFDRDLDAGSKPHRPIPSGRLRPRTAVLCGGLCVAVLIALAVTGGWRTTLAAVLGVLGIVVYSRWAKARGIAGNLVRGALGALALLYGACAAGQWPASATAAVLVLAAVFWLHDTTSNLVGTLRDIDGDRTGGYFTLAARRGAAYVVWTVLGLYAATIGAALAIVPIGVGEHRGPVIYLITLAVVVALGAVALAPLVTHRAAMSVAIGLRAHEVLVVERLVLASGAVGLGLGVGWQLGLLVPLAALTWRTQHIMRPRHELGTARTAAALVSRPVPVEGES